jgi:hypothetical protein
MRELAGREDLARPTKTTSVVRRSDFASIDKGLQSENVPAVAVSQETEALARTVSGLANPDMVEISEPEPMDREAATANLTRNLSKRVKGRIALLRDVKDADALAARRA